MQAAWLLVVVVIGEAIVVTIGLTFWDRKYPSLSVPASVFSPYSSWDGNLQYV